MNDCITLREWWTNEFLVELALHLNVFLDELKAFRHTYPDAFRKAVHHVLATSISEESRTYCQTIMLRHITF